MLQKNFRLLNNVGLRGAKGAIRCLNVHEYVSLFIFYHLILGLQ